MATRSNRRSETGGAMKGGRRRPYTEIGIRRVGCFRCAGPGNSQWQVCADGRRFRVVCLKCDIALNEMVLRWMGFTNWRTIMRRYVASRA